MCMVQIVASTAVDRRLSDVRKVYEQPSLDFFCITIYHIIYFELYIYIYITRTSERMFVFFGRLGFCRDVRFC